MRLVAALALTVWIGCVDARPFVRSAACPDFTAEVQPVLERACLECHGPTRREGDFSAANAAETLARRASGEPRIVAGSAESPLLAKALGSGGHPVAAAKEIEILSRWIVTCQVSTMRSEATHPRGWINPESDEFHGLAIRAARWDFDLCTGCHGALDDRSGGKTGQSCYACHVDGPTGCGTCHGTPANPAPAPALDDALETAARGVGAHALHVGGGPTLDVPVACEECHIVPIDWDKPGHVFDEAGMLDPYPAEVVLGTGAGRVLAGFPDRRNAEPSYDAATGTCSNVYCHGAVLGDSQVTPPVWTSILEGRACDTCHGMPPADTHPSGYLLTDCVLCHGLVVDDVVDPADNTLGLINATLHLDARVSLGDDSASCSMCHGSAANAAPPSGVRGASNTGDAAVGAHQSHVRATTLHGSFTCAACHIEPSGDTFLKKVIAPGHIDSLLPAEVFPGAFAGLAAADEAAPVYDAGACSTTYCHGGGAGLALDAAAGILRTVVWTDVGNGTVVCGSCHGLPPATPSHPQRLGGVPITIDHCIACHPLTVDGAGAIIVRPGYATTHINGTVD